LTLVMLTSGLQGLIKYSRMACLHSWMGIGLFPFFFSMLFLQ
jgi:hypothetical protein